MTRDCGDLVAFHAGAVGVEGEAWLLAGPPDVGKTSCTLELVEMGHSFLAEEVALVDPDAAHVLPYPQTLSVDPRMIAARGDSRPLKGGETVELEPGHWRYLPARVAAGPLRLGSILLPRYSPQGSARVEELRPEDALAEILGYCFEPRGDPEAFFDRVIRLISGARIARFEYADSAQARKILGDLAAG